MPNLDQLISTIQSAPIKQALRAFRKGKRIHLQMEINGDQTSSNRRDFETRLEDAIERRRSRGCHNTRELLREELDDVCLSYA